jgi:hypothetical protein
MASIQEIDQETLFDIFNKKMARMKKIELVEIATSINKKSIIDKFEQIGHSIEISMLTMDQLKRFINKNLTVEIVKNIIGPTINVNVNSCSICMELMGKQRNSLECGHWVHFSCMEKNGHCPICRKNVINSLPKQTAEKINWNKDRKGVYKLALFD